MKLGKMISTRARWILHLKYNQTRSQITKSVLPRNSIPEHFSDPGISGLPLLLTRDPVSPIIQMNTKNFENIFDNLIFLVINSI
jgi:hypothetical protein